MTIELDPIQTRVLGCLVEKELATPEYYPLTLNALSNACNQKSNRDPVMALEESDVQEALDQLRQKQLAHTSAEGVRSTKYCHNLEGTLRLEPEELAILAELLLRGPQTPGELRTRASRMHPIPDLEAAETFLCNLMERDEPLVVKLPRQPGRKEHRFAQRLSGPVDEQEESFEPGAVVTTEKQDRTAELEAEVAALRAELAELRQTFEQFRAQFD
jgi:uncharacterized protein YceH (UPF0502 family)